MTPTDTLRALREALARGTKGPFGRVTYARLNVGHNSYITNAGGNLTIANDVSEADAALIVAAVNALEKLIDVAEAAFTWEEAQQGTMGTNSPSGLALRAALARLGSNDD